MKYGQNKSGAALLLALWALFLLGALVMSWALDVNSRLGVSGSENRILEAEAMASSGAEVALNPAINPGSSNLQRNFTARQGYKVRVTGEGGRLNINWIVAGENPTRLEMLRRYLEFKGIDLNERDHMMDCLLDWVDPDNIPRLNGAEASEGYQPANALLTRIDEMKKIKGWEAFTSQPGWDDDFTLNSAGPVDLAWASRAVLRCIPGLSDAMIDRFLQVRAGPDGIEGTADDAQFQSLDEIRSVLGLSPQQFQAIAPLISFHDSVMRVTSTGFSGDTTRVVQMIFRRSGATPQMITWKEF
ncbi:MAG: general secretion pathway protein GspK [Verrucomicrobia bacterium]|nr:general secretion pathway protein GspK [Verrucomicrobiota bacterium]